MPFLIKLWAGLVVMVCIMMQDMLKIQAALGGQSGQGGGALGGGGVAAIDEQDEAGAVGLLGAEPDCRIFLSHDMTTLIWLKSHHLMGHTLGD